MRKAIFCGVLISLVLAACSKKDAASAGAPLNPNGDNTTSWIGTYTGAAGGSNTINRVIVSKANDSVVQMLLQLSYGGSYYSFATIHSARLTTTTTATIDEAGVIAGYRGTYHFAGSAVLSGSNLTISGGATRIDSSSPNPLYYFSGSK